MFNINAPEPIEGERVDFTVRASYTTPPHRVTRYFVDATNDELRNLLHWDNPKITRPQLLAACHNRWKCGYWMEEVKEENDTQEGPLPHQGEGLFCTSPADYGFRPS
jgi:hypothetical protein